MERKVMEMFDKIEVPKETSKRAEELLISELLNEGGREMINKEQRTTVELQNKKARVQKIVGVMAATAIITVGIMTVPKSFHIIGEAKKMAVSKVTVTAEPKDSLTKELQQGGVYVFKEGKNLIDLDLDGVKEQITLKNLKDETSEKPFRIMLGDQVIRGEVDREEGLKVRAMMLTREKKSVQILFTHTYMSDDFVTAVYNYEDGKLVKVGEFKEEVDAIERREDGSFRISQQGGVVGLYKHSIVSLVPNDHSDSRYDGKYMLHEEDQFEKKMKLHFNVTALREIKMYTKMDRTSKTVLGFRQGETGTTLEVVDGKWLYLKNSEGQKGYLEITPRDFVLEGKIILGEYVFEGLPYAG